MIHTITTNKGEPHEAQHRVDTDTRVSDVRSECPNFFSGRRRSESVRAYKGFLIVQYTFQPSVGPSSRNTILYAYDIDSKDTMYVDGDLGSPSEAKALAKELLTVQV